MAALIEAFSDPSLNLYAMLRSITGTVWHTGSSTWVAWNAPDWANYAIALTEDTSSGFYHAAVPAIGSAQRVTILIYNRLGGAPAAGDQAFGNSTALWDGSTWESGWSTTTRQITTMGLVTVDVGKINGVAAAASKLSTSASTIITGKAVAGTLTVSQMTTDLAYTVADLLVGRVIYFTSGTLTGRVAAIAGYVVAGGKLTFYNPLPSAPTAGDDFVVI